MPYEYPDPNRTEWKMGLTLIGKIVKPGSKLILHGNGRTSLNFSVIIPTGIPFDKATGRSTYEQAYFRCKWFDPDEALNVSDVVEVQGTLTKVGKDLGLLVNRCHLLGKFVKKTR